MSMYKIGSIEFLLYSMVRSVATLHIVSLDNKHILPTVRNLISIAFTAYTELGKEVGDFVVKEACEDLGEYKHVITNAFKGIENNG